MNGFRLGKIFGIEIHVDWSWFVIFVLITWSLAVTFGQIQREWPFEMRWGLALLVSSLFLFQCWRMNWHMRWLQLQSEVR
jgi:Zn-dependent protease